MLPVVFGGIADAVESVDTVKIRRRGLEFWQGYDG